MQFFRGVLSPVLFVRRVAGSVAPDTGFNRRGVAFLGGISTSSQPRYDMHKVEEGSESSRGGPGYPRRRRQCAREEATHTTQAMESGGSEEALSPPS